MQKDLAVLFVLKHAGLPMQRRLFFAQANHPQNLYYQTVRAASAFGGVSALPAPVCMILEALAK